jgi:transcription elongation factor Elf1
MALYRRTGQARILEVNPNEESTFHTYDVPCPVCDHKNPAQSLDGKFFINTQLACRQCGVYFRPVVDPNNINQY